MNKFKRPLAKISGTPTTCPRCGEECGELISSDQKFICLKCVKKQLQEESRLIGHE